METSDGGIIIPTNEEVADLQGITDPGEQLVGYYNVSQRLSIGYRAQQEQETPETRRERVELLSLHGAVTSQLNRKFAFDWQGQMAHVEAINEETSPIQVRQESGLFSRDSSLTLLGSQPFVSGKIDVHSLQPESTVGISQGTQPLWLQEWRLLRRTLMHEVQVVEPKTGTPLVHIDFLDK